MNIANTGREDKPWWRRHNSATFEKGVIFFEQREAPAKCWAMWDVRMGMGPWDTGTQTDLGGGTQASDQRCTFMYIHGAQ